MSSLFLDYSYLRAKAEVEKLAEKCAIALEFKKMGLPVADIAKGIGRTVTEIKVL